MVYTFDEPVDGVVLAVIPKYSGIDYCAKDPAFTFVIKTNVRDQEPRLDCLDIKTYVYREPEFCSLPKPFVYPESIFKTGVLLPSASSIGVADSEQNKIKKVTVAIDPDKWVEGLGIYQNKDGSYPFPNIGEKVRDDGALFATRQRIDASNILDPTPIIPDVRRAQAGASVVDITIRPVRGEMKNYHSQIRRYIESAAKRHRAIYQTYLGNKHLRMTQRMRDQVVTSMHELIASDQNGDVFSKDVVEFFSKTHYPRPNQFEIDFYLTTTE